MTTFRESLRKNQIIDLASNDVKNSIEVGKASPLEAHVFFKRLKVYVDAYLVANEKPAIEEFEKHKLQKTFDGAEVSFTQGGTILDYSQDSEYRVLEERLKARKELLDFAFKSEDPIFDGDGAQVPKVGIKGYRKDSLNVRL